MTLACPPSGVKFKVIVLEAGNRKGTESGLDGIWLIKMEDFSEQGLTLQKASLLIWGEKRGVNSSLCEDGIDTFWTKD